MQTYLVGGAVRDELLGIPIKDRDWLVVGSTPDAMIKLGYKQVGIDFPVFLHPKSKQEYALARTERKSGHGYTGFLVDFSAQVTIEEDLLRRDLTINAIAKDSSGALIDPFNGQQDIEQKILRHVSPAFREDPLRVLRIARFAARFAHLGFTIAEETEQLLNEMAQSGELQYLVAERVWAEMAAAVTTTTPSEFFRVLRRTKSLKVIFPELDALFGIPQPMRWHPEVDTGIHSLAALDIARTKTADVSVLVAALCHDLGKGLTEHKILPSHHGHESGGAEIVKKITKKMKWPTAVTSLCKIVCRYHTQLHSIETLTPKTILKLIKGIDGFRQPERIKLFTMACESDIQGRSGFEKHQYIQKDKLYECIDACIAITAKAFVDQGLKGVEIGAAIDASRLIAIKDIKAQW